MNQEKHSENLQEMRFYMPLTVETCYEENESGEYEILLEKYEISPKILEGMEDELTTTLNKYASPERLGKDYETQGLMAYYTEDDGVKEKIQDLHFNFEEVDGEMYGVATCHYTSTLHPGEMKSLKEYITGQASDGLGEGFEQYEFQVGDMEISVSFWNSDGWYLKSGEEMGFAPLEQALDEPQMGGIQ